MLQYVCTNTCMGKGTGTYTDTDTAQTQTQTQTDSKTGFRVQGLEQMTTRVRAPGVELKFIILRDTLATH